MRCPVLEGSTTTFSGGWIRNRLTLLSCRFGLRGRTLHLQKGPVGHINSRALHADRRPLVNSSFEIDGRLDVRLLLGHEKQVIDLLGLEVSQNQASAFHARCEAAGPRDCSTPAGFCLCAKRRLERHRGENQESKARARDDSKFHCLPPTAQQVYPCTRRGIPEMRPIRGRESRADLYKKGPLPNSIYPLHLLINLGA